MDANNKSIWTPGEGKKLNLIGDPFVCKVTGDETANGWSFFEAAVMPGSVVPEHKHDGFDEAFYILEGELEMQMDGRKRWPCPRFCPCASFAMFYVIFLAISYYLGRSKLTHNVEGAVFFAPFIMWLLLLANTAYDFLDYRVNEDPKKP